MKKILFFDIDGTLLSETTHVVPLSTANALTKAKEKGHLIFINTGRPYSTIDECIKQLPIDGYICGCGTYIRYHDQVLFSKTLSKELGFKIRDLIRKCNIEGILEGIEKVYFDSPIKNKVLLDTYIRYNDTPTFNLSTFDDNNLSFDKFGIWFDEMSDIESFRKEIVKDFEYIIRDKDFWEIVPLGYSKATGIQFLLDYFNLDKDDAYVFGDSFNDVAMLKYVKHSVVMGNSDKALYEMAYFVTRDIEDDGIEYALEHLALI